MPNRSEETPPRKPSAILRAIGERIAKPEAWTQEAYARAGQDGKKLSIADDSATCWCWDGALIVETPSSVPGNFVLRVATRAFMLRAIGRGDEGVMDVHGFNDTHTHAEVIAANARAIEMAESEGQ